jgi:tetratricopeptide (TPR) repeat protein
LPVSEEEFASSLANVLSQSLEGEPGQRQLLGVVQRQLAHANHRFERGDRSGGTASVMGAFYLLQATDQQQGFLDHEAQLAIRAAIASLSARGEIGKVSILLELLRPAVSAQEQSEIDEQLRTIARFREETLTGHPMVQAGDRERTATARALLSPPAVDEAVRSTSTLIDLAIAGNQEFQQTGRRPTPEVADEIIRGLDAGAFTIVAHHFRQGSFEQALETVEESSARLTLDPDFFADMNAAVKRDDARSYRKLYDAFSGNTRARAGGNMGLDKDLFEAATFALLRATLKRAPHDRDTALEFADLLTKLGLPEAVPAVLREPAKGASDLELVEIVDAMVAAAQSRSRADDHPGALHTLEAAVMVVAPLRPKLDRAKASLFELHQAYAQEQLRAGRLAPAIDSFTTAFELSFDARVLLRRAEVKRALGDHAGARADLELLLSKTKDPLFATQARLSLATTNLALRDRAAAQQDLVLASELAQKIARTQSPAGVRARAYALLGRAHTMQGQSANAKVDFENALREAESDANLLGQTMLETISSLWLLGERDAMLAAFDFGAAHGAPRDAMLYAALWLHYEAAQAGMRQPEELAPMLENASELGGWHGRLARFALGKLSEADLSAAAVSEVDRVEARFYSAMARRARGLDVQKELLDLASARSAELFETRLCQAWTQANKP